jgi:hypothetical protein
MLYRCSPDTIADDYYQGAKERMTRDIADMVQRLQLVKRARGLFLGRWAAECIFDQQRPLKRLECDLLRLNPRAPFGKKS